MKILIDSLINCHCEIAKGLWMIARPVRDTNWMWRLRDAWAVLTGQATAVVFGQDLVDQGLKPEQFGFCKTRTPATISQEIVSKALSEGQETIVA